MKTIVRRPRLLQKGLARDLHCYAHGFPIVRLHASLPKLNSPHLQGLQHYVHLGILTWLFLQYFAFLTGQLVNTEGGSETKCPPAFQRHSNVYLLWYTYILSMMSTVAIICITGKQTAYLPYGTCISTKCFRIILNVKVMEQLYYNIPPVHSLLGLK